MMSRTEFAYAQVRIQARHGQLPDALRWRQLEASRTAGQLVAQWRAGPWADWVDALDELGDVHHIERQLRSRWRAYVDEVAGWLPSRWQGAIHWFGTLVELPLIDAVQRDAHAERWLRRDPRLAAFSEQAPAARQQSLRAAGLLALERQGERDGASEQGDGLSDWLDEWTRRLPPDASDPALLRRPAELLWPGLSERGSLRGLGVESVWHSLLRLFRRHATGAVAVFAHLALVWLMAERLRGGLVVRALFETRPAPVPH